MRSPSPGPQNLYPKSNPASSPSSPGRARSKFGFLWPSKKKDTKGSSSGKTPTKGGFLAPMSNVPRASSDGWTSDAGSEFGSEAELSDSYSARTSISRDSDRCPSPALDGRAPSPVPSIARSRKPAPRKSNNRYNGEPNYRVWRPPATEYSTPSITPPNVPRSRPAVPTSSVPTSRAPRHGHHVTRQDSAPQTPERRMPSNGNRSTSDHTASSSSSRNKHPENQNYSSSKSSRRGNPVRVASHGSTGGDSRVRQKGDSLPSLPSLSSTSTDGREEYEYLKSAEVSHARTVNLRERNGKGERHDGDGSNGNSRYADYPKTPKRYGQSSGDDVHSPPFDPLFELAVNNETPELLRKRRPSGSSKDAPAQATMNRDSLKPTGHKRPVSHKFMANSPSLAKLRIPSIQMDAFSFQEVFSELEQKLDLNLDDENSVSNFDIDTIQEEAAKIINRKSMAPQNKQNQAPFTIPTF